MFAAAGAVALNCNGFGVNISINNIKITAIKVGNLTPTPGSREERDGGRARARLSRPVRQSTNPGAGRPHPVSARLPTRPALRSAIVRP